LALYIAILPNRQLTALSPKFIQPLLFFPVMVALNLVKSSNAALVASQPLVAVFFGGTSGIGSHTIKTLAGIHGKGGRGLRAYVIGRSTEAAEEILSDCRKVCPSGHFQFIRAPNLALMKDVDVVCAELTKTEEEEARKTGDTPRIDILVMSQANFKPWDPRNGEYIPFSLRKPC
jgi:hypothetical protein